MVTMVTNVAICFSEKPQSQYTIRLHTTIPDAPFKPVKLVPDRNNLRPHALQQLPPTLRSVGKSLDKTRSSTDATDLHPTPHYNRWEGLIHI